MRFIFEKYRFCLLRLLSMNFLIYVYISTNIKNDLAIMYTLPEHEVSTENIDMGQRNQIRGQSERERERETSCCLKK